MPNKKLIIITSDDWYFLSHRLPVAEAGRRAGFETIVVTGPGKRSHDVWAMGYRHVVLHDIDRTRGGFFRRLKGIRAIARFLREEQPAIVFAVSLRFGLMSKIASRFAFKCPFIILMPGLGFLYSSERFLAKIALPVLNILMRWMFSDGSTDIVVQNKDNMLFFRQQLKIPIDRVHMIRGSGVRLHNLAIDLPDKKRPVITLAGRMLWSKGVREFVEAAKILRKQGREVRMVLVGVPDAANPDHVSIEHLSDWKSQGTVEWWGFCDNMNEVWQSTSIAVFPTWYGEGIPKALLEAASFARPVVASDVAGCRDVVVDRINGIIIKPKSAEALAGAISTYLDDADMATKFGLSLQSILKDTYDEASITEETATLFQAVLCREKLDTK